MIEAAARAMGATSLKSIQYCGTGSSFVLGQAPGPGKPWPRFGLTRYVAAVDYNAAVMREELVRTEVENPPRGGGAGPYNPATGQGGIRPIPFGEQTQIRHATARTETGLLQIWMTPHGFLKAAAANNATATAANVHGRNVHTVSFTALGKYTVTGTINDQNLVESVETRIANTVLGDMLVETIYSDYRDFTGVKFPTRIVQRQGGHPTLDLTISDVQPNSAEAAALEVPESVRPATAPPVRAEAHKVADGVWGVARAGLHSYLVEFNDHLVVIEAPLNDEHANAVIAEVKRLAPNKPIRYLVNTHHHFDHAGGLRGFVAEGVTIITHEINKPYYEEIFRNPFQLNPDRLARSNRRAVIEGVRDQRVLTDGATVLELYHIRGNLHDEAMLMAYLRKEKMLIQTDAFNPRPGGPPLPSPSPFTVNLFENIQRLELDVAQILHIHGGIEPFAALAKAAGQQPTQD